MLCKYCNKEFKPKRKGNVFCSQTCNRNYWSKKNKDKVLKSRRDYKKNNPYRIKEQSKKYDTTKKDKIKARIRAKTNYHNEKTNVCHDCHEGAKTEFHHISYSPNIFIELCRNCHRRRHYEEEDLK